MDNEKFTETFREEARELLGRLESYLLELEGDSGNAELLSATFRVMHTVKGSAAMFGLDRISAFAHDVESIMSALRDGKIPFSRAFIDNTLAARDYILEMLESKDGTGGETDANLAAFLGQFRNAVGFRAEEKVSTGPVSQTASGGGATRPATASGTVFHIVFVPGRGLFRRGVNVLALLADLRKFGETVCIPKCDAVPPLSSLDPEDCLVGWDVFLTTSADENAIRDVFIFVEGDCSLSISRLTGESASGEEKRLGDILVGNGKLDRETLERFLGSRKKIGEVLLEEKVVSRSDVKVALEEQRQLRKAQLDKKASTELDSVRVKSEKLDELMALVGELVTVQARVMEASRRHPEDADFLAVGEEFGRLTDELRGNAMRIRMVSVGATFAGFKRLVRDLSAELGKKVNLEITGEDTELDKTVIEKLHDPLVHIIRNSLDHGLETPDVRAARGKAEAGTIRLSATHAGSFVSIVVEDDGNGLDCEAIRRKAVAKGLLAPDATPGDDELFRLILLPGFSTNDTVTAISGRGVGMDVVNRQMSLIGGTVELQSASREYTRITLKIPLTLAIIDGLLVRVADEHYVVPLAQVDGCLELDLAGQAGKDSVVVYQGHQLPYVDLRDFFGSPGERPAIGQLVIVTVKGVRYGLLVDRIIGGTQAVIKPLGELYSGARGLSGATIRGDGSVALILDPEGVCVG